MPEWTLDQQAVIHSDARELLCSAAAGSGKTAVLVERVVRMIRENVPVDRFLIVTFTTAAASEMKEKIRKRLREESEDRIILRALENADIMEISTIHSFCQRLIRQEFQAVGIDPLFRICDSSQRKRLFSLSFRAACNMLEAQEDQDFAFFCSCYGRRQAEELVSQVHSFMMSLPDPLDWLHRMCGDIPETLDPNHRWFQCVSGMIQEKLFSAQAILRRQYLMFDEYEKVEAYRAVWKADSEMFHVKHLWSEGADTGVPPIGEMIRLPRTTGLNQLEIDWRERYRELREELKKLNQEIETLMTPDPGKVSTELDSIRKNLRALDRLVTETSEEFQRRKKDARCADFNDLEHFALRILREEPYRSAVQSRYEHVFVDECQDISAVQDAIIRELHGPASHLFMVGDVKQSIYRFRLADPTLFLSRLQAASPEEDREVIFLQENFRSRPEILETANTVFRDIMRKNTAEMDYSFRDELKPGRVTEGNVPVCVDLILREEDDTDSPLVSAADHVTHRIRELLAEKDPSVPEEKQLHYRDIVILMPAVSTTGNELAELLRARGVPVFFDGGRDFFSCEEVAVFRHLLEVIDLPHQDVALISTLKNPPFLFTEEELARVRLFHPGKNVPFWQAFEQACGESSPLGGRCVSVRSRLEEWRLKAETQRLSDFLWYLLGDSSQYALARMAEDGDTAQANLRMLCDQALRAEENGIFTLRGFLKILNDQAASGDQRAVSPMGEKDDLVRIMTMHKSKGLQFPVVFCLGLDHAPLGSHPVQAVLDAKLGICLNYKEPRRRVSRKTVISDIFAWKKRGEEQAEKIRLLYVGMTRAQERMYLVGCRQNASLWNSPPGEQRIVAGETYLDWVMPALLDAEKAQSSTSCPQRETCWEIRTFEANQQKIVENRKVFNNLENWLESLAETPPVEELWTKDPVSGEKQTVRKTSVTRIIRDAENSFPEEDPEETMEDKRIPERFRRALLRYEMEDLPAFMNDVPEEITGARRGTLTHRFLSLISLEPLRENPEALPGLIHTEKERMKSRGIFTEEEAAEIREEWIIGFFRSGVGVRMLRAKTVRREWNFNLFLEEQNLLVQGVADCVFLEEDSWVLLDYKTDRVANGEELLSHYQAQLDWYALAIRKLTNLPVREKWLYSLSLGCAFRIPEAETVPD